MLSAAESARSILYGKSAIGAELLCRCTFEWERHLQAILDPVASLFQLASSHKNVEVGERAKRNAYRMVVDRLRAYAVWGLWSDIRFWKEASDDRTLSKMWSSWPAEDICSDPERCEEFKKWYPGIDLVVDRKKLQEGRKKQEAFYLERIKRAEEWLCDTCIQSWVEQLDKLGRRHYGQVSFFELMDKESGSLCRYLDGKGMRAMYGIYAELSALLHGSTLDKFILIQDECIIPKFEDSEESVERLCMDVAHSCAAVFVQLAAIDGQILSEPDLRK